MKLYAKQVPPDYQESPLMIIDEIPEDIIMDGNNDYKSYTTSAYDNIINRLDEVSREAERIGTEYGWYKNITECIVDYIPPENPKSKYSTKDINHWKTLIAEYDNNGLTKDIICRALRLVTGTEYDYHTIRGCSQSEWQVIFCPATDSKEYINCLEIEYFNTGSEWIVHDEDSEPATAEDINGYSVYCHSWDTDGIKKEIAEYAGIEPEEVTLYEFDDYIRQAVYKKVTA